MPSSPRISRISALYRDQAGALLRYFMRNGIAEAEAQDILQECFVNLVRSWDDFKEQCSDKTWLWTIARNRLITHARQQRPMVSIEDDESGLSDCEEAAFLATSDEHRDMQECVRAAFHRFASSHPQRAEVLALVVNGWEIADLATFLGRTLGATREYLSQCRKALRPFIEHCRTYLLGE